MFHLFHNVTFIGSLAHYCQTTVFFSSQIYVIWQIFLKIYGLKAIYAVVIVMRIVHTYGTHTHSDIHTLMPMVTPWDHTVCDGVSQLWVTSFNAAALFSPLLMRLWLIIYTMYISCRAYQSDVYVPFVYTCVHSPCQANAFMQRGSQT